MNWVVIHFFPLSKLKEMSESEVDLIASKVPNIPWPNQNQVHSAVFQLVGLFLILSISMLVL